MKRTLIYAMTAISAVSITALASRSAMSSGQNVAVVRLQTTTPGTVQQGHMNVSGNGLFGNRVGIGTPFPANKLHVMGDLYAEYGLPGPAIFGNSNAASGFAVGVLGTSSSASGLGVSGINTSTSGNTKGVYGEAASPFGTGVYGIATATSGPGNGIMGVTRTPFGAGVYGQATDPTFSIGVVGESRAHQGYGVVGSSIAEDAGTGVQGWAHANTGEAVGVRGDSYSISGYGVYGVSHQLTGPNNGVMGFCQSVDGAGVYGWNFSNTGATVGVRGTVNSPVGTGVAGSGYAVGTSGHSFDFGGKGVYGVASTTTGVNYGVYGESYSDNGFGVFGTNTRTSGTTFGVYGQSDSASGFGVVGYASSNVATITFGVAGQSDAQGGTGVRGFAASPIGTTYGVSGEASSASGFGLYSFGNTGASGNKSFRIDHPLDPLNKYLLHYATESPEPQNAYNGVVTTDDKGEAWVRLPAYFASINKDFRYQLTVLDDTDSDAFVQAKVAKKIQGNQFKIRTNAPNVEVSWEVKATRNDLWNQVYGAPTEVDKQGREKGKYQHPGLYGAPPEMGMNAEPIVAKGGISKH